LAEVCLGVQAEITFTAFGCIQGNDSVAYLQGTNARPDFDNNSSTFMAKYGGKSPLRVIA
jgi:hypothetical protein